MSILIKGAKKPKECYCCPCSTINMNGRWGKCNLLGRDYAGDPHKIYNDCPLVEIPPHGRLIDKGTLMGNIEETYCTPCPHDGDYDYCKACRIDDALDAIEDAPTVIESEEE